MPWPLLAYINEHSGVRGTEAEPEFIEVEYLSILYGEQKKACQR